MPQLNDLNLLQDIENAFSDATYPGDDNLVYDNSDTTYPDVIATKKNFLGKHWKDLSFDTINRHRDDLPAFTPEAFCFYLPAFLLASILHQSEVDVLPDNITSLLTPRDEIPEAHAMLTRIVNILSAYQKKVVLDFLEWRNKDVPDELKPFYRELEIATKFWRKIVQSSLE